MTFQLQSQQFLISLYLKSRNNLPDGYDADFIARLSGLDQKQSKNVQVYLSDKGYIKRGMYKQDPNVYLTASGIDQAESGFKEKDVRFLKFDNIRALPATARAVAQFIFFYSITDEKGNFKTHQMQVTVSDVVCINWGYPFWSQNPKHDYPDLIKILSQYVLERVSEKLKEGTLSEQEELVIMSSNYPAKPDYDPVNLADPLEGEYAIVLPAKGIIQQIKENQLAALIIQTRDNINAIFSDAHKARLLKLDEERNLLDFFKQVGSEEEFVHRIASLAQVSRNLNVEALRRLTGIQDGEVKSVQLLTAYLQKINRPAPGITDTLLNIGRIRQGYPVHSDISKVITGLKYFSLAYPLTDYAMAWETILQGYANALTTLFQILVEAYIDKKEG